MSFDNLVAAAAQKPVNRDSLCTVIAPRGCPYDSLSRQDLHPALDDTDQALFRELHALRHPSPTPGRPVSRIPPPATFAAPASGQTGGAGPKTPSAAAAAAAAAAVSAAEDEALFAELYALRRPDASDARPDWALEPSTPAAERPAPSIAAQTPAPLVGDVQQQQKQLEQQKLEQQQLEQSLREALSGGGPGTPLSL